MMSEANKTVWASRLDAYCAVFGGLLPLGLVIGNIGFELIVATVGLLWLVRSFVLKENSWPGLFKQSLIIPYAYETLL